MDIQNLVSIEIKEIPKKTITFSEKVQEYCKLPYDGHPKGCINYGKKKTCPPQQPFRKDVLENYSTFVLALASFDFKKYKQEMKKLHPLWSEKQLANVIYWQNSVKTLLKNKLREYSFEEIFGAGSGFWGRPSMEAVGINVFHTLKLNGIPFEMKPKDKIVMVALMMFKGKMKKQTSLLAFLGSL